MKPSETFLIRVYHRTDWKQEPIKNTFETYSDIVNFVFTIDTSMDKIGVVGFPIILLCSDINPDTVEKVNQHFVLFDHVVTHQKFEF